MTRLTRLAAFLLCCAISTAFIAGPTRAAGVVSFAQAPRVARADGRTTVSFTLAAPTDVEVAVLAPDGKVVRHLAAGVLGGANAPPPPLKAGLAQAIEWDGKDDLGKPAGDGPFKLRVRAGTGVTFGRFIGDDPYTFGHINSLATDDAGNLYATACAGDCNQYSPTLRVFAPDGRYLRTLMPFPADLKPEDASAIAAWDAGRAAFVPKNFQSGNPITYPFESGPDAVRVVAVGHAGAGGAGGAGGANGAGAGGLLLSAGTDLFRMRTDGGQFAGPTPMWAKGAGLKNPAWNTPQIAMSADGRYIYYSNVAGTKYQPKSPADTDPKFPQGRIYRQDTTKPGADPEPFYDLELPDWEQAKYWLPDAWNKRTAAYGIAIAADGHLYVCDLVNQQIVELGADGKKISATKVPWPEVIHVTPDGELYVISRLDKPKDGRVGKKLLKLTGRGDAGKIVAEMPLKDRLGEASALGKDAAGKPVLWLAGGTALVCLRDAGDRFEPVATQFKPRPDPQSDWARLAIDGERDEVYVNNGTSLTYRYDGRTGEGGLLRKDGKPFYCVDICAGYDSLLYARTGDSFTGPLARFAHDLEPAPFATGSHVLYEIYNRMGIGYSDKGVGAGPKGETYNCYMYGWNRYFVAGFGGDGRAIKGKYLDGKIKKPEPGSTLAKWPEDRLVTSAVVGPVPAEGGGVCVDLAGNIYIGMRLLPKGYTPPAGFAKDQAYNAWTGSIVKFPPGGGAVIGAIKAAKGEETDDPADDGAAPKVECNGNRTIVNALAVYPGLGPFSGGGYGANSSVCVCRVSRFGIDRYGRLAYANAVTCSATVIDNAGNKIVEFGGYGNFDSRYVNPALPAGRDGKPTVAVPEFPMAWPTGAGISDRHVYVLDTYAKRVVRADLTWAVEVVVP